MVNSESCRRVHSFSRFLSGCLIVCTLFLFTSRLNAQEDIALEEIDVMLNVPRLGGIDVPALIKEEVLYLSVTEVFDFLKIKNTPSSGMDSITGFLLNPEDRYELIYSRKILNLKDKSINLKTTDLIRSETGLYLKSDLFGDFFGLYCHFDFRALSVTLTTKIEFPALREMKMESMRNNINKLSGQTKVDSVITRKYYLFKSGILDWSLASNQDNHGPEINKAMFNLASALAGGTAELGLNVQSDQHFNLESQHFLWKYVNNQSPLIRQVRVGSIYPQTLANIDKQVLGLQFSNTPTTFRKSYGTYQLNEVTQPNWIVELYVNNILVDYKKADASGFFTFEIPLVYGSSEVSLRYFGPWGEEQERKMNISIPFNFLPRKELEYTVSLGMVEDSVHSKVARIQMDYGLSSRITIGAGTEYLSSIASGKSIPFINASYRLGSRTLVTAEYDYGIVAKGLINYSIPTGIQLEGKYALWNKDQKAIHQNYLEERSFSLIYPIRYKKQTLFTRVNLNQILLPEITNTTGQLTLSTMIFGTSNSINTSYMRLSQPAKKIQSDIMMSSFSQTFKLPSRFSFNHTIMYQYKEGRISLLKCELNRPMWVHSFLSTTFDYDFKTKNYEAGLGFRTDLSFAQTAVSGRINKKRQASISESVRGSLAYDGSTSNLVVSNRSSIGKGGLVVIPFLDLNRNGRRDKGEKKIEGTKLNVGGGRIAYDKKDTLIRITDLEPYTNYTLDINRNSFNNISWQLKHAVLSIAVDPNVMKLVEIPVQVSGEASGEIVLKESGSTKGLSRISVQFTNQEGVLLYSTLTESDGYFSVLGLAPGQYRVQIDSSQLTKLRMKSSPKERLFTIVSSLEGDIKEGLNFYLTKEKDSIDRPSLPIQNKIEPEKKIKIYASEDYFVQLGAYTYSGNAEKWLKKFRQRTDYPLFLVEEKGLYKIRIGYFTNFVEAKECYENLKGKQLDAIMGVLINKKPPFILLSEDGHPKKL